MTDKALQNTTVLVTRPKEQSQPLCEQIQSLGGRAISLPTISIHPLKIDEQTQVLVKEKISKEDIAIFLSANAATYSEHFWHSMPVLPQIIAIGSATEKTLNQLNLPVAKTPTHHSSEGLIELLKKTHGKTIYLCSGENARPLLRQQLSKENTVIPIICYYRQPVELNQSIIQLLKQPIDYLVTTSQDVLASLHRLILATNVTTLLEKRLIVSDEKHLELAKKLGFNRVLNANGANTEAIIKVLTHLT